MIKWVALFITCISFFLGSNLYAQKGGESITDYIAAYLAWCFILFFA